MENKFISEAEMFKKDARLPEALMCVAYFQDVQEEKMAESMKIEPSHAAKLVELLEECGFVKTENGKRKLTFTQEEYLKTYRCSVQDLESLFGNQSPRLDKRLAELDALLPEALLFAAESGKISITAIRRRFGIGYPRAARIVDIMENEGFISPSNENAERTVYVKKEDFGNLSKFSGKESKERESFFAEDQQTLLKERKKNFNLDNVKLLDENGKTLSESEDKRLKDLLIEQFCGWGIVCIEIQDAKVFFEKNNNVMRCKTFDNPSKEELQTFFDDNKVESAIILYEVNPKITMEEIQPLIPKIELACFAIATPLPSIKHIKVNVIY